MQTFTMPNSARNSIPGLFKDIYSLKLSKYYAMFSSNTLFNNSRREGYKAYKALCSIRFFRAWTFTLRKSFSYIILLAGYSHLYVHQPVFLMLKRKILSQHGKLYFLMPSPKGFHHVQTPIYVRLSSLIRMAQQPKALRSDF